MAGLVLGIIGQKGGGGKSTTAKAAGVSGVLARLKVVILDCDPGQHTSMDFLAARMLNDRKPYVPVKPVGFDDDLLAVIEEESETHDLVIVDARGHSDEQTLDLAGVCDLLVIPSAPNADDLIPAAALYHEITEAGGRCEILLNRVGSPAQSKWARAKLAEAGITPLADEIPDQLCFQNASTYGRAIVEVPEAGPRTKAQKAIKAILKLAKTRKRKEPLRFTEDSL